MSQPVNQNIPQRISGTAAGTTIISPTPCNFNSVTMGANKTGTLTFYNSGTGGANQLTALDNTSGSIPVTVTPNVWCNNGLTVITGGTTDALVGWSK